jgi:hypothetical protein
MTADTRRLTLYDGRITELASTGGKADLSSNSLTRIGRTQLPIAYSLSRLGFNPDRAPPPSLST